jgi:hypothetical protein
MQIPPDGFSAITLHSLAAFLLALGWVALLFVALAGYGALLLKLLRVRITLALAALSGIAVATLVGGLINAFYAATRPALLAFVLIGLMAAALWLRDRSRVADTPFRSKSLAVKLLLMSTLLIFAFRIAASVHDCHLQDSDDFNYYLAAPVKMLATHSFRGDVFSERRVMSSIGGNEFFDTLVIAVLPVECTQMADWTLGIFLVGLLAFAIGNEFALTEAQRYALAFFFAITPQLRFNLTFVLLPSAMFMGMVYVAARDDDAPRWREAQALLLGALVGAVASMKSSYVVHGVLFLACIVALRWWKRGRTEALRFGVLASLAGLLVMLPWMLANIGTAGTMFYPLLGKGFQYSAYGHYPPPTNPALGILLHKVLPFCIPMMVVLLAEWVWGEREERSLTVAALMLAALLGSVANGLATGGDSVRRYNYPCILPAITLAYVVFARRRNTSPAQRKWLLLECAAAAFALLVGINTGTTTFTSEYRDTWQGLKASLTDYHATTGETRERYAALQQAIPAGSTALASLQDPFLLNFSRSKILIADWPGAASPKPGWPLWENADALAAFLLDHGVRYLLYDYNDCHFAPQFASCHAMLEKQQSERKVDRSVTQWLREEAAVGYDARHQYEALAVTRRRIYDDGENYILDLEEPATTQQPALAQPAK